MTLHLAIQDVLSTAGGALTPRQIADAINARGLYQRNDGTPLPAGQVSARVRKYPALFMTTAEGIRLTGATTTVPSVADQRGSVVTAASTEDTVGKLAGPTDLAGIERDLLADASFRRAADIDGDVPDRFGLYAIRVRKVETLPEPFRSIAQARDSRLIYLGEATGQTLRRRFLGNELRGHGHGTFFRSIGAVLGYRPPVGSLVGKANPRNYRFSPADTALIVDWINAHLEVSWTAFADGIHASEVTLIRKHTPLLNLRDNPRALPELSTLRAECCAIAGTVAVV